MTALGQQLIETVRRIATHNPDFVYMPPRDEENGRFQACQYVRDGKGSCLIGRALFSADIINADFELSPENHVPFTSLVDYLSIPITHDEASWLREVQRHQDNFRPWGEAVKWADDPQSAPIGSRLIGWPVS